MQVQTSLSAAHFPAHLKSWIDIAKAWSRQAVRQHHSYRPEKHYMRGSGPKWHEKHAPRGDTAQWPKAHQLGRVARFYSSAGLRGIISKCHLTSRRQQPHSPGA